MDTNVFWKDATALVRNVAKRTRLNPRFVGGDVAQVKEDMMQEGLMGAAIWLSTYADFVAREEGNVCRRAFNPAIKLAMFDYLRKVNRDNGHELSASEWMENMGEEDDNAAVKIEQEPEDAAQDALDEIIENNENSALKEAITCLDKEMQAVVLLNNDGFSFTEIARKMNFSRERPRQLYHKAMRQLKMRVAGGDVAQELPLDYPHYEQETLLFSSQEEKIRELKFRVKSTRGNISNLTRLMRREGKNGQLPLF